MVKYKAFTLLFTSLILSSLVYALAGDLISDVVIGEGSDAGFGGPNDGVGVAFDGTYLYYSAAFFDPILHRINTTGGDHLDINVTDSVTGLPVVVQAMSYDAGRNKIWAADGSAIYLVDKNTGVAEFKFDTGIGCGLDDGLAYDSTDDSIWWSCDGATTVSHFLVNGTPASPPSFALAGQMVPECGFDYSSGIAVGGDILYLGADGCDFYFTFHKNGTKIQAFNYTALRSEDLECDPITFAPTEVMWIRDAYDGHIRAYEIPVDTCKLGGISEECGNRIVEGAEECDDGNNLNGDGCSATCKKEEIENKAPNCKEAVASNALLWPPNHKFVPINVNGVTDPDGDNVTINITGISQDEKTKDKGIGSGNTCPDASGIGTDTANVRAERNGNIKTPGNGRVYHVGFTANDGNGGSCSGTVRTCIPHDQSGAGCIDDGALYNSLLCA